MRLRYEVAGSSRGLPVAGAGELAWRHDGERYEAQLEWTQGDGPGARRSLHSVGRLTAQGLAPERFSSRVRSEEAVHFDAAGGLITFSAGPAPATLAPGAQDRLAVLLQLAALLAGRPADFPPGRRIAVQVATAREAGLWHFEVEGEETLDLPGGAHRAVRLRHPPMHAYDPALEAWFAPGLAYAPVRVRLTLPGGDWLEHRWSGSDSARGRRASTWPGGELRAAGTP